MPVTINTGKLKIKNGNDGYIEMDAIANNSIADMQQAVSDCIIEVNNAAAAAIDTIPSGIVELNDEVDELRSAVTNTFENLYPQMRTVLGQIDILIGGGVAPTSGSNTTGAGLARMSAAKPLDASLLMWMDSSEYQYVIWCYAGAGTGTATESPTNKGYTMQMTVIPNKGSNNYFKIGFKRVDGANMTSGAEDTTSDEYKILHALRLAYITDVTMALKGIPADAKAVGDLLASKQDTLSFDSAPTSASANPVTSDGILKNSINARGTIPSESDIDDYKDIGIYAVSTKNIAMTLTHWPITGLTSGTAAQGILIVFAHRESGSGASFGIGQIAISADQMFVRIYDSSTWKSWMEVYNSLRIDSAPTPNSSNAVTSGGVYSALKRQNPVWVNYTKFYSHLFIDGINQAASPIIPSESVFEVSVAKRLGFDMIEGHLQKTADNKYVVMHGVSGKIGYALVKTVDGSYDPDTAINSLTLEQIRTNYRYRSQIAKYQVPVTSAEEWLLACRNAGMIPIIYSDDDAIPLVEQYCKDYIRYGGQRTDNTVMLMQYQNKLGDTLTEAKSSIDALITTYGLPLYINTFSIDQYADDELIEIVHYAHEKGAFIGACNCYYDYGLNRAIRAQKAGFDFAPSAWEVNDFSVGNITNLSSDFDFDDFVTTGSESGGVLTLAQGDTITIPAQSSIQLGKGILKVLYDGKITVAMGRYWTYGTEERRTYSSDGRNELSFSTYYLNEAPTFTVTATEATTVRAISYKSAEC